MSLVVHKLVLSPGGAATNTQNPTHHVTLAAYTHPRSNVGETMGRSLEGPSSVSVSASPSSLYSSSSKHSSTYNLPFVLQDHNYGAPPPPTPPQSPPPLPTSSAGASSLYHLSSLQSSHHHQTHLHHHNNNNSSNNNNNNNTLHQSNHQHHHSHHQNQSHTQHHINLQHHHSHNHQQQLQQKSHLSQHQNISNLVVPSSRLGIVTSTSPTVAAVSGISMSHPLAVMPPHRQQFMPHPKASIFPSPHIPPMPVELHQTSSTTPAAPPLSSAMGAETDDDSRLSDRSSSVGPSGEETETAPEGEGDEQPMDDSITRCICDFSHDDGYMIQCDRCFVWQHVDCMEIDRNNIPDEYLCEACEPRHVDRFKARALQIRRRQEIKAHLARLSSSDSDDNIPMSSKSRGSLGKSVERKVVKKKKTKQIKDLKNSRKGSVCQIKKSNIITSCNNNIIPDTEDKERRMLVKTRRRKSSSMSGGEGVSDDSTGGPVERLRAWVEDYEIAVTNHYSPELRARVHAARINGVSPDLRASTQGALLGHRCKVVENPHSLLDIFDSKILVAATTLTVNTAIAEYQGKYLLASQWIAQQPATGQVYLPYVLQYHMPKEGLSVCVDARTYGNDARFTRRSCRPNAEVRHVVERGSLHLYLVAMRDIEETEEVTLALDTANSTVELVCCYPEEEHDCHASPPLKPEQDSPSHQPLFKKNGIILNNKKSLKKQNLQPQLRMSKRTTSTESRCSDVVIPQCPINNLPVTPVKQRRASGCGKSPAKSPCSSASSSPEDSSSKDSNHSTPPTTTVSSSMSPDTPKTIDKQQQQKMTREERKIAAYMKAFERMEKAAQRRQEIEKKKEEDNKGNKDSKDKDRKRMMMDGEEDDWEKTSSADESIRNTPNTDSRSRRKGKKGRGKGSPQKRNSRIDSTASDFTGDESSCASVGLMSPVSGTIEGIALNFNSPPQGGSSTNIGFRFPKTKKSLMNEWLNETVDPVMPAVCSMSGGVGGGDIVPTGVPTCYMRSPATPLRRSLSVNNQGNTIQGTVLNLDMPPGGSAKKRWLRQAISEETETPHYNGLCPSPNSRPDSPTSGGDYITPLKKRRLARESMSSEQSCTPPTTPVHSTTMEDDKIMEEMEAELAEEVAKDKVDGNGSEDPSSLLVSAKKPNKLDCTKDNDIAEVKREDSDDEGLVMESDIKGLASKILKDDKKCRKTKKYIKPSLRGSTLKRFSNYSRGKAEQLPIGHITAATATTIKIETSDTEDDDKEEERNKKVVTRSSKVEGVDETKQQQTNMKIGGGRKPSVRARRLQGAKKGKCQTGGGAVRRSGRQQLCAIKKGITAEPVKEKEEVCKVKKEEDCLGDKSTKEELEEIDDTKPVMKIKEEETCTKKEEKTCTQIEETYTKKEEKTCTEIGVGEIQSVDDDDHKVSLINKKNEKEHDEKHPEIQIKIEEKEGTGVAENPVSDDQVCPKDIISQEPWMRIKDEFVNKTDESSEQESERRIIQETEDKNELSKNVVELGNDVLSKEKLEELNNREQEQESTTTTTTSDNNEKAISICDTEEVESKKDTAQDDGIKNDSKKRELKGNCDLKEREIKGNCDLKEREIKGKSDFEEFEINQDLAPANVREISQIESVNVKISEKEVKNTDSEIKESDSIQIPNTEEICETKDKKQNEDCNSECKESFEGKAKSIHDSLSESKEHKPKRRRAAKSKRMKRGTRRKPVPVEEIKEIEEETSIRQNKEVLLSDDDKQKNNDDDLKEIIKDERDDDSTLTKIPEAPSLHINENQPSDRSQSSILTPLDISVDNSVRWQRSLKDSNEETSTTGPRTPESPLPISTEIKGPRTPDGPAPSSPDEPPFTPTSPRSPSVSVRTPPSPCRDFREARGSPERIMKFKGPCTPPPRTQESDNNNDETQGGPSTDKESLEDNDISFTTSTPKPAPVKRKLSILEYRKRKSVNSETDCRGTNSTLSCSSNLSSVSSSAGVNCGDMANNNPPSHMMMTSNISCQELAGSPLSSSSSSSSSPNISKVHHLLDVLESPPSPPSPPDLPLSPIQPLISLMLIPDVLDKSLTKELIKEECEKSTYEDDCSNISTSITCSSFVNVKNGSIPSTNNSNGNNLTKANNIIDDNKIISNRNNAISNHNIKSDSVCIKNSNSCNSNRPNSIRTNNIKNISKTSGKISNVNTKNLKSSNSPFVGAIPIVNTIEAVGAPGQDVKWNAAPTLLERQRENLTERLRREFGLCVSDDDDDDDDKSDDDRDRMHKRAKDKNLPPPPPPPTAPPKNSIFHGREVTVQKVASCSTKMGAISSCSNSSSSANTGLHNIQSNNYHRLPTGLQHSSSHSGAAHLPNITGSYAGGGISQPLPVPPPATGSINPTISSLSLSVALSAGPGPPPPTLLLPPPSSSSLSSLSEAASLPAALPVPCSIVSPRGGHSASRAIPARHSPIPIVQPMGDSATHPRLSSMASSGQINQHSLSTSIPPPQNSSYPLGPYPRNMYSNNNSPSGAMPPQSLPMYSPVRVAPLPPPPHNSDGGAPPPRPGLIGPVAIRQQQQQHPPVHGPPRVVAPSLGYSSGGYPGLDCSGPGSRGS